jgi:hypothetical protein
VAAATVTLAAAACGIDAPPARAGDPDAAGPSTRHGPPAAAGSSVLDVLDDHALGDHDRSEQALLRLVTAPESFDDGLRTAAVQVDDPNGNGRVDGHWYPPRVVTGECEIKTDQAPMPRSAASFIPGDPADRPLEQFEASRALLEAPYSVGVSVQVFDDAAQRDGMAATLREFYDAVQGDLECGLDSLFGDVEPVEPVDIGPPGFGFRSEPLIGTATTYLYSVEDRVLLTVGLTLGPAAEDDPAKGPAPDLLERAVRAEAALLESTPLPGG